MKKRLFVAFLITCTLPTVAQQLNTTAVTQLEVVELTSTKFKLSVEQSGKIVEIITQKDLKKYQGSNLANVLDNLVGIEILGNQSTAGQNLSYNFRGGANRQVLILIDGVAVSNPSAISNDYDLRLLPLDQIESVEIIKGAISTIYGSGAATAVINIKLKEALKNFKVSFNTSVATNSNQDDSNLNLAQFTQGVSVGKKFNKSSVYFSFDTINSGGLSAAIGDDFKDDDFSRQNLFLKYKIDLTQNLKMSSQINYNKFTTNFDATGFADAENLTKSEEFRLGVQAVYTYTKGDVNFKSTFNSITNNNKKTSFPSVNKGESITFDVYNRYAFNDNVQFLLGVNTQIHKMNSLEIPFGANDLEKVIDNADFNSIDPYANVLFTLPKGINFNLGFRLNTHSTYGSHLIYTVNPSYNFKLAEADFKVMASYSTAFITPTLFQLFSPSYGFTDLEPEENTTLEGGFTFTHKKLSFNAVYFYRQEQSFIDFTLLDPNTFQYGYRNIEGNFYINGLETGLNYTFSEQLNLKLNYTLTNVADTKIRIPKHKFNASFNFVANASTQLSLDFNYTDKRIDKFFDLATFTSSDVTLKSFSIVSLYGSREVIKNRLHIYANITNIFNVDYQELVGFSTRGRNFLLGLRLDI